MSDDDATVTNSIHASLGSLYLEVEGADADWVRETFDAEWAARLDDAEQMSQAVRDGSRGCQ